MDQKGTGLGQDRWKAERYTLGDETIRSVPYTQDGQDPTVWSDLANWKKTLLIVWSNWLSRKPIPNENLALKT
jgi:hypothetical protein